MPVLYVTEQGAEVGVRGPRLVVRKGRTVLGDVRIEDCPQVVLMGMVQVSTQAVRALLDAGVEVLYLTRGGRFLGRLSGGLSGHIALRRRQFRQLSDPTFVHDLAVRIVEGKVRNQQVLLRRYQAQAKDERIAMTLTRMRCTLGRLSGASTLDQVRGMEGLASREFFGAFGRLIRAEGIVFTQRLRRPPPDPVNLLLSFGYTLLAGAIHGMVEQAGMDPYLGALHEPERGRPSLVLDLMEEFRPILVDTTVIRVLNTRAIGLRDFAWPVEGEEAAIEDEWEREEWEGRGSAGDGENDDREEATVPVGRRRLLLSPLGARKWVSAFERRLAEVIEYPPRGCRLTYRQILLEQVYRMARHFQGKEEYRSFCYSW